jgi:hypothetical protein
VRRAGVLISLPLLLGILAWGCSTLRVEGTVTVKGNVPHTCLVLVQKDNTQYSLVGPLAEQIWRQYQGRTIRVEGRILKASPAPGIPAELEVIRVLAVREEP